MHWDNWKRGGWQSRLATAELGVIPPARNEGVGWQPAMRLIALILVLVALAVVGGTMRAQDIQVKKWPDDVPCGAVKKNADGSYTQTKDLMMGAMRMSTNTFGKDTAEARAWDKKCIGKGA